MKLKYLIALTVVSLCLLVEAKNPAKIKAAKKARAKKLKQKAKARARSASGKNDDFDERGICDAECQAKKAAKEAAKAQKAAEKQAAKEAKAAAKAAKAAEKAAAKQAAKEAKAAAKAAKAAAKQAAKEAKAAAKQAAKEAKAAAKAAAQQAKQEKKEAEALAKLQGKLEDYKLSSTDVCVDAEDFVSWTSEGDVDTWNMGTGTADSRDGYLTVMKPDDAPAATSFYLLIKASKGSKLHEVYLEHDNDDFNLDSVPGKAYYRIAGFVENWCPEEASGYGSGSGNGSGDMSNDDEDLDDGAFDAMEWSGEVTVSAGSADPENYEYFYCYTPTDDVC